MLNFTPSEKRAINLTVIVILAAGIIQLFKPYSKNEIQYDYEASDSIFSRLTHQSKYLKNNPEVGHYVSNGYNGSETNSTNFVSTEDSYDKSKVLKLKSININTALSTELQRLPRIGPAIAKRILEYRDKRGSFKSIEELLNIKGIGEKTLENIKPYLKL